MVTALVAVTKILWTRQALRFDGSKPRRGRVECHSEGWKSKRQPRFASPKENRERGGGAWIVVSFEKGEEK